MIKFNNKFFKARKIIIVKGNMTNCFITKSHWLAKGDIIIINNSEYLVTNNPFKKNYLYYYIISPIKGNSFKEVKAIYKKNIMSELYGDNI